MEMAMLARNPIGRRMGMIEILGVTLWIVYFAGGIMPPICEGLLARCDLAEDVSAIGGQRIAACGDDCRRGLHGRNFARAHPQVGNPIPSRHPTTSRERNVATIASGAFGIKPDS